MSKKIEDKEASSPGFIDKILVVGPPLLVISVICFLYGVFMLENIIPQIQHTFSIGPPPTENDPNNYTPSIGEIVSITVIFHAIFFLTLLCFLRCYLTPAGSIPYGPDSMWVTGNFNINQDAEEKLYAIIRDKTREPEKLEQNRLFLKSLTVVERKYSNNGVEKRKCQKCDRFKPDRTHHCRVCGQCVLRMDHHCPWIANCVGFNNYKFFILFLFYASLCLIFILGAMLRRLIRTFRPVVSWSTFARSDLPVIIAFLIALFLCIALVIFFFFHMRLIFNCLTTIELREKRDSENPEINHRWAVAHTKYDQGSAYKNFLHVFGSPWMWLLPIQSNLTGTDGTYSEGTPHEEV